MCQSKWVTLFLVPAVVLTAVVGASAQIQKKGDDPLSRLEFTSPKLALTQPVVPYDQVTSLVQPGVVSPWRSFHAERKNWTASVDRRNGNVVFASGDGIPWFDKNQKTSLEALERTARDFLKVVAPILGIDPGSLVLDRGRSMQAAPHVWFVDFNVLAGDTPIDGARVLFRVNNGNLIQFGSEYLPSPGAGAPAARLDSAAAKAVVEKYIGGFKDDDQFYDRGSLHLITIDLSTSDIPGGAASAARGPVAGVPGQSMRPSLPFKFGQGRGLARVWQFVFHRPGIIGTFQARVDATTGELLEFRDINDYAQGQATGGVASDSTAGTEIIRNMPFVDLGGGVFANSAGLYTFSGTPLTSALNGQYIKVNDTCGAVSLTTDGSGNLVFNTGTGSNCTTPGVGGAGNTRSSRTAYYELNRGMELARGWLPGNTFLNGQFPANVNKTGTCNGYWVNNTTGINLFRAVTGSCGASGEEPGFIMHEFGHGIDANDGNGSAPDGGSRESYADMNAVMVLHRSCVGAGFRIGNCTGYGDNCTSCTGLRDVDWAQHTSNAPHTVDNYARTNCAIPDYSGPCGNSAHCESVISTEAVWDFVNRDLPFAGTDPAWAVGERLYYSTRPTATGAFTCDTTAIPWTSNGCSAGSLWEVFRALDDDDGNLANGTPHGAAIYAAFNRHGIACTTDPGATLSSSGCTPPAVPSVTVTGGSNQTTVSWTALAGDSYDVYRNEDGCNHAFTKIGAAATSPFTDTAVANGTNYFYQVVAYPTGNPACSAAPSSCTSANLVGPDPSIRPWGAALNPPLQPLWQTSDIWVDNNGNGIPDEVGEPSLNKADNHLFARVTNTGNAPTSGYRVSFAAKPYTTNASAPAAAISSVDEPGPIAPGASQTYQVTWDLTAAWIHPNFPAMFWNADHFCVQVTIGPSTGSFNDADTTNNFAQNNFDNIPVSSGGVAQSAHFFLYNHLNHAAIASLQWVSHTPGWSVSFQRIADPKNIPMQPQQWIEVVAVLTAQPGAPRPTTQAPVFIDVSQQLDGTTVGGLTMGLKPALGTPPPPPPTSGKLAVFADLGAAIPNGALSNGFNSGVSFNGGLEFIANPHFSAEGILGIHHFGAKVGGDLNVFQFTGGGKVYFQPPSSSNRVFARAGLGGYHFSVGSTTNFGGYVGGGLLHEFNPHWGLEGVYTFHAVNTPGTAAKFSTIQGGFRYAF